MLLDFKPYLDKIDACVYMGQSGSASLNALAELLCGRENFSGRLSDTLTYSLFSHPSVSNRGDSIYQNMDESLNERYQGHYTVYQEGIYVGYKYFETRYMDSYLNPNSFASSRKGAVCSFGGWNYSSEVAFPFGYGLSYSSFSYSNFKAEKKEEEYIISLTVTNEGNVKGKDVVQVYLSKPYTDYDRKQHIEKSGVELVGFSKTKDLLPLESQTVTISVPFSLLPTYDASFDNLDSTFGRYILEGGDYYLTVASSSHNAAENLLLFQGKDISKDKVMKGEDRHAMDKFFVYHETIRQDVESFRYSKVTKKAIHNELQDMDINAIGDENKVRYLSRNNYEDTYPEGAILSMTERWKEGLKVSFVKPKSDSSKMPKYSTFRSGKDKPDIDNGDLVAGDFISAPFDETQEGYTKEWDEKWNQLLDQMSYEEQLSLSSNSYHKIEGAQSINLPSSRQENGPLGIEKKSGTLFQIPNSEVKDWIYHSFPSPSLLSMTFNLDLIEDVGKHMSEDLLYLGYNGIYGPCGNIHRSPFGGRNFEYYSEDTFLSSKCGMSHCKGIQNKGCIAFVKHFAFNDTEMYRRHNGIFGQEQAMREIYLSVFENMLSIANGVMSSLTRCGTIYCGMSETLQTTILREEWGFKGLNITDYVQTEYASKPDILFAGTNLIDGNSSMKSDFKEFENDPDFADRLRQSAKLIIYNVLKTNAFNGLYRSSKVIKLTPPWQISLYVIVLVFGIGFLICLTMLIVFIRKDKKGGDEK